VLVSAGFDAARGETIGGCDVTPHGFAQMTRLLQTDVCKRLILVLEGGYELRSLGHCVTACAKALLGGRVRFQDESRVEVMKYFVPGTNRPLAIPNSVKSKSRARVSGIAQLAVSHAIAHLRPYWWCLRNEPGIVPDSLLERKTRGASDSPMPRHVMGLSVSDADCVSFIRTVTELRRGNSDAWKSPTIKRGLGLLAKSIATELELIEIDEWLLSSAPEHEMEEEEDVLPEPTWRTLVRRRVTSVSPVSTPMELDDDSDSDQVMLFELHPSSSGLPDDGMVDHMMPVMAGDDQEMTVSM